MQIGLQACIVVYISSQWDKVGNMANLLIGEYEHTLDEKSVSRFRKYSVPRWGKKSS